MSKVIHVKKFKNGQLTPQEYFAAHSFPLNAKCNGCGCPPSMRAMVFAPFDEVQRRGMLPEGWLLHPDAAKILLELSDAGVKKRFVRISVAYSCRACSASFERALAQGPSWCVVEINRGPDPTNRVSVAV